MAARVAAGAAHQRARRWDVLILGTSLSGLVAAIRLGMARLRVLVAEEEPSAGAADLIRDPFFLTHAGSGTVLGACLHALGIPMTDRRGFEVDPVAYQVLLPRARVEVGGTAATAEELTAWGLAKPETAWEMLRALEAASEAECEALLASSIVRRGALRNLPRGTAARRSLRHPRGLPESLAHPTPDLAPFFEAQVRALSGLGEGNPSPEARARLLGMGLSGGTVFDRAGSGLRTLLRRRIETLHGEFRTIGGPFELTVLAEHPGIARIGRGDFWLGRALLVNAPESLLAGAIRSWDRKPPSFLEGDIPRYRRLFLHLRAQRDVVPEALARRAILVGDPSAPLSGANLITLATHPSDRGELFCELIASAVVENDPTRLGESATAIEDGVRRLMPFSQGRISRLSQTAHPLWDDDSVLPEPEAGDGWPGEAEVRTPGRQPVFRLRREALAGLGVEGELLLGWRAGEAIREDLS